jgi:hypothetical protein
VPIFILYATSGPAAGKYAIEDGPYTSFTGTDPATAAKFYLDSQSRITYLSNPSENWRYLPGAPGNVLSYIATLESPILSSVQCLFNSGTTVIPGTGEFSCNNNPNLPYLLLCGNNDMVLNRDATGNCLDTVGNVTIQYIVTGYI